MQCLLCISLLMLIFREKSKATKLQAVNLNQERIGNRSTRSAAWCFLGSWREVERSHFQFCCCCGHPAALRDCDHLISVCFNTEFPNGEARRPFFLQPSRQCASTFSLGSAEKTAIIREQRIKPTHGSMAGTFMTVKSVSSSSRSLSSSSSCSSSSVLLNVRQGGSSSRRTPHQQ